MKSITLFFATAAITVVSVLFVGGSPPPMDKKVSGKSAARITRGKYLVAGGACNDCHSPKVFTAQGPVPDEKRLLSGHPADQKLPDVPPGLIGPTAWGAVTSNDLTAWVGPWGTSFTRNLTPDTATGIGSWTESIFIKAMRTGKDMGEGRDILPPMPWPEYKQLSDEDLKSIFAYLKSLPPIENAVPDPIAPTGERMPTMKAPKK